VSEGRAVQQALQQGVPPQARPLPFHHLLQLRAQVAVQLQAAEQRQQAGQARLPGVGRGAALRLGAALLLAALQAGDGQLDAVRGELTLQLVDQPWGSGESRSSSCRRLI